MLYELIKKSLNEAVHNAEITSKKMGGLIMGVRKNTGIKTKPPSYKEAVAWIANNDEPDETDKEVLSGFISVCLVADLFHKTTDQVAKDVVGWKAR